MKRTPSRKTTAAAPAGPVRAGAPILTVLVAAAVALGSSAARAEALLWQQNKQFLGDEVPSVIWPSPPKDDEAADDFDVIGSIERVVVGSAVCYLCAQPDLVGFWVRFYEWRDGEPGELQYEAFVASDDPNLGYSPLSTSIRLPTPFQANGMHFIAVQLESTNQHGWGWSESNRGAPNLASLRFRDRLEGDPWGPYLGGDGPMKSDLAFELWGIDETPPPQLENDPCGDWEVLDTPVPPDAVRAILRDGAVVAPDDVWAVGDRWIEIAGNLTLHTVSMHWDGAAWSLVPTPSPEPYENAGGAILRAVDAWAADDVWAGGSQDKIDAGGFVGAQVLVMHWDGTQWQVMDTPDTQQGASGARVRGIEIIAPDDIWFVGDWAVPDGCNMALAMHWDGSGFEVVPTPCDDVPNNLNGFGLEAVSAVSSNDVWAVGGAGHSNSTQDGYILHWDGTAWTRIQGPTPGTYQRLFDVEAIATDDVWATGQYFDMGRTRALMLHWDGASWTQVDTPDGRDGLHAFASADVYASAEGIYHWNGAGWSFVQEFPTVSGPSLADLDAATPCGVYGVGRQVVDGEPVPLTVRHVAAGGPAGPSPGVSDGLTLRKNGAQLDLEWNPSCSAEATDYAVYEGAVGAWYSHEANLCSTGGATSATITPQAGDRYFLVVPLATTWEGSYGADSEGRERPPAPMPCQPEQNPQACP